MCTARCGDAGDRHDRWTEFYFSIYRYLSVTPPLRGLSGRPGSFFSRHSDERPNRPFAVNVFGGRAGVRGTVRSRARYAQYEKYGSRCRSRHLHATKQHFPVVHTFKIVNNTIFVLRTHRRCRQRVRTHDELPPRALYYTILCAGHTRVSSVLRGDCCSSAPRV